MRIEDLFAHTLRDAPADAELASHQLAIRAGLVRPVAAGIYALMPLGWRVIRKIEAILREEMDSASGLEMRMPVVHPAEIWQATGRWESFGPALQKFTSDSGRNFVLGPTHEEVIAMLAAREVSSYRQLPALLYQIQTKFRNEPRARGGLVRLREFTMKDAYSLDADADGLDRVYERMVQAYRNIFARAEVPVIAVEADTGAMGGKASHEFVLRHDLGEDRFVACDACGYAANVETAQFALPEPEPVPLLTVEKVATPNCKTIQEVADFIGVLTAQTLKAVFFMHETPGAPDRFVFVTIRGDLEVNETKLINALGGGTLRPATDGDILAVGAVPGYASPIGLAPTVQVVADQSVRHGANFVAGANAEGYHLTGVNVPRDFNPATIASIAEAFDGATCGRCGAGTLHIERAIELGHCFKLGTRYSEAVKAEYEGYDGLLHPVIMGSYGIGLERLIAAIIEIHHDAYGIIWPRSVAPFDVHLLTLGSEPEIVETAGQLYHALQAAGVDTLYDDRGGGFSPGVKFADADLIGVPLRLTVSKKSLANNSVEVKWRAEKERSLVPLDQISAWVQGHLT